MAMNARLADNMYQRGEHDIHLVTLPLFHSFGQSVQMNAGFYTRATISCWPALTQARPWQPWSGTT